MNITDIKRAAKTSLKGKWWSFAGITLIYLLVSGLLTGGFYLVQSTLLQGVQKGHYSPGYAIVYIVFLCLSLCALPLGYGYYKAHIESAREDDVADPALLFAGYKRFWFLLGLVLLMNIIISFGTMLLIVPGIILSLAYAMWPFIVNDHPEFSIKEVLEYSRIMMMGYKADLFVMFLSFLGWILLSFLTFGIGLFFVIPYIYMSTYHFYEKIRYEVDERPEELEETIAKIEIEAPEMPTKTVTEPENISE